MSAGSRCARARSEARAPRRLSREDMQDTTVNAYALRADILAHLAEGTDEAAHNGLRLTLRSS